MAERAKETRSGQVWSGTGFMIRYRCSVHIRGLRRQHQNLAPCCWIELRSLSWEPLTGAGRGAGRCTVPLLRCGEPKLCPVCLSRPVDSRKSYILHWCVTKCPPHQKWTNMEALNWELALHHFFGTWFKLRHCNSTSLAPSPQLMAILIPRFNTG